MKFHGHKIPARQKNFPLSGSHAMSSFDTRHELADIGLGAYPWRATLLLFAVVLAATLAGILGRPPGQLASFWPTNAILLGLMVRNAGFNRPLPWLGAVSGYLVAGALTGEPLLHNVVLTVANMAGVVTATLLYGIADEDDRLLRRPGAVLMLIAICGMAACMAGVIGALANPLLFNGTLLEGWLSWFVSELVTYIAILPVFLAFERSDWRGWERRHIVLSWHLLVRLGPVLTAIVAAMLAMMTAGPGAGAFPVPALLWAAIVYTRFQTALLTLIYTLWLLIAIQEKLLAMGSLGALPYEVLSVRLAIALIALGPIAVSCVTAMRNRLLTEMEVLANHDTLTGLLNRRAFFMKASAELRDMENSTAPVVFMMIDIDHFKSVNDRYGHAGGDAALALFAIRAKVCLRQSDLFGRLGGEEFAVLLPGCPPERAREIAEQLRRTIAERPLELETGGVLDMTLSIGLAYASNGGASLDQGLSVADQALYDAKANGRNRVEVAEICPAISG